MILQEVMNKYAHDNNIDALPEYQQMLKPIIDTQKSNLNLKYFPEELWLFGSII